MRELLDRWLRGGISTSDLRCDVIKISVFLESELFSVVGIDLLRLTSTIFLLMRSCD